MKLSSLTKEKSARLVAARKKVGFTQHELAVLTGYARSTIANVESGREEPSAAYVQHLQRTLLINPEFLETGEGEIIVEGPILLAAPWRMPEWAKVWVPRLEQRVTKLKARLKADLRPRNRLRLEQELVGVKVSLQEAKSALPWSLMSEDPQETKEKSGLTSEPLQVTNAPVQPILPNLLERLRRATAERGRQTELAAWLGVPRQNVNAWLTGAKEPGGETTLRLLHWVEQQERTKQQAPPA